jgi:ABC-type Fe3+-hydroxamate transport system substrate-binding protein
MSLLTILSSFSSAQETKEHRIISLVPSLTEFLFDIGLEKQVVGITKFCVHPKEWFQSKDRIGGTKNINIEKIKSLLPSIVIASKEENVKDQVEALQQFTTVVLTDISTFDNACGTLLKLAEVLGKAEKGKEIVHQIQQSFRQPADTLQSSLYFIWRDPYYAAGADTFITSMMKLAGFENLIVADRYPEVSIEQIQKLNPEYVLLSSEPYPFKQKHIDELQHFLPNTKIVLVDGEYFSWYGSRMLGAKKYFEQLQKQLQEL